MSNPSRILGDPGNFLHSIDIDADRATFFRTNPEILREASFIDGRTPIATTENAQAPLSAIAGIDREVEPTDRFLFNCSFCGSTQLARLLDVPDRSLVLKEPRCLTDLASYRSLNLRDGRPIDRLRPALKLARAALRRRFAPAEAVTVKVASQGNLLLDTLAEDAPHIRPIFMTISRAGFLRAIFRGGVERMHYAARIAWHMAVDEPEGDDLIKEAVRAGGDPVAKAANIAIVARHLQLGKFQRAARVGGWNDNHVIDFDQILTAPQEAAIKAAKALDLSISEDDIDRNVAALTGRYSKGLEVPFSPQHEQSIDRMALADHQRQFDAALAWAESALGPQRTVAD